tara:strand:+ start:630 stop:863 length:234 start_codon:yes stop_codon:yes gene_type:complete
MNKITIDAFLLELADALEISRELLKANSKSPEFDWDSLSILSALALIDSHFGIVVSADEISKCHSAQEIISLLESSK